MRAIYFCSILFFSNCIDAAEFVPAKFVHDKTVGKIAFPRMKGDFTKTIPCGADLPLSGRLKRVYCFLSVNDESSIAFEQAIQKGLRKVRLKRALLNGKAKSVWLSFEVVFERKGEQESIEIIQNLGLNRDKYGMDYIGAQRIIGIGHELDFGPCGVNINVWLGVTVNTEGQPIQVKIAGGQGANTCKQHLLNAFRSTSYIPAHKNGLPVQALYYEPMFTYFGSRRSGIKTKFSQKARRLE